MTVWKGIHERLVKIIEEARVRKGRRVRKNQFYDYYSALLRHDRIQHPWKRTLPSDVEAAMFPSVRALIENGGPDDRLSREQFTAIEVEIIKDAEKLRESVLRDLARLVREPEKTMSGFKFDPDDASTDPAADLALLDSPAALFVYVECEPMTYVGVLDLWQRTYKCWWEFRSTLRVASHMFQVARAECMPHLLNALGMPSDTTMTALEEWVACADGTVRCACGGFSIDAAYSQCNLVGRMVSTSSLILAPV